jgi:SAM-dependent methyltransferase
VSEAALWHDLECGGYAADLPLWRKLAADADGVVLDVGAGTGRVALDLARRGHTVVALDRDAELLDVLAERATGLPIETVCADARTLDLGARRFALVLVPMQTIQLLGGVDGRASLLRAAKAHLTPGAAIAIALADALEGFDAEHTEPPLPDTTERDGIHYASQPVAVRDEPGGFTIERIRQTLAPDGQRTAIGDAIRLDRLDSATLESEAEVVGLRRGGRRSIAPTGEHVGSEVVLLHG